MSTSGIGSFQQLPVHVESADNRFEFNGAWQALGDNAIISNDPSCEEYEQFWLLVWRLQVTTIITFNEAEDEYVKKGNYWVDVGNSEKTIAYFKEKERIFVREIPVTFHGEKRTIFYYRIDWPDKGVITPFVLAMLVNFTRLKGKLLVHGRKIDVITTFFIAYTAYLEGEKNTCPIALDMCTQIRGNPTEEQRLLAHQTVQLLLYP